MLKNEFSDPSFRNLGQQFAKSGKTDPRSAATAVQHTWNNLPISSHEPIAYETAKNLTDQDLQTLAKTKEGREFLQKIENGMMDGNVEPAHQAQIDRIRKAHLSEALPTKELSNALPKQATTPPADGLKPGESISAKVTETGDITKPVVERTFNFSRPVTKQQAAAIEPPATAEAQGSAEAARLLARASALLGQGNIGAARIVLERAAEMGSAEASFMLAETYDPLVLSTWKTYGTRGDVTKARELYAKALAGGIQEAKDRSVALR